MRQDFLFVTHYWGAANQNFPDDKAKSENLVTEN